MVEYGLFDFDKLVLLKRRRSVQMDCRREDACAVWCSYLH